MLETKKVFISGPMTGLPEWNKPAFDEAEKLLRKAGFTVFNPCCLLAIGNGWSDQDIAAIDLTVLGRCNYIYQLDGWSKSKGASAEWQAALWMGLKTINKEWLEWYVGRFDKGDEEITFKGFNEAGVIGWNPENPKLIKKVSESGKVVGLEEKWFEDLRDDRQKAADEMNERRMKKMESDIDRLKKEVNLHATEVKEIEKGVYQSVYS